MTLKVLSLFSGVGGFDLGLERATMETVYQCEIDKNCRAILEKHWPLVPKWDDITTLTGEEILSKTPIIDVVAWGSPCQDLSVAGKRAGLAGEKSNLFYEGIRIINELRKATNGKYPAISIWENVAGALNSNGGNDFGLILDEMAKSGASLIEWALLDAQYFGIPQRRRRVFVVAIFDSRISERCPDPLFTLGESLRGDNKTRRSAKQDTSDTIKASARSGRKFIESFTASSFAQYKKGVGTLRSYGGDLGGGSETLIIDATKAPTRVYKSPVQTLKGRMGTGGNNVPVIAFSHTQGLDSQPSELNFPTLRKEGNGHAVLEEMKIRRLTPKECERLQGWPDDHTRWRADGKEQTDGHRYRQCGNGVASPVATWIGEQIVKVTNQTEEGK